MKRLALFSLIMMLCTFTANAQIGGLVRKAASKAVNKAVDKAVDKATDKAAEAIEQEIENEFDKHTQDKSDKRTSQTSQADETTYLGLMKQLPELPTVQQFVNHKEAEFNEQSLKLLVSPVTKYSAKSLSLSMQSTSLIATDIDSAQATEMAYKYAQQSTGLSREEIDKLSTMSEDEQQAYLQAHYREGTAEAALMENAAEAAKYLEPIQPIIDKWTAIDTKIDALYAEADGKCQTIYKKYADQLAKAGDDKSRNKVLLRYYGEILPIQHVAVKQAMQIRMNEQLPIAEQIEKEMVSIRAKHQDAISILLNYPQMTATRYFLEYSRLTDIPEYK